MSTLVPFHTLGHRLTLADPDQAEAALIRVYRETDDLKAQIDKLAVQLQLLLAERAHIKTVLSTFYRATHSLSSMQSVINLALELDPTLGRAEQLPLKDTGEPR